MPGWEAFIVWVALYIFCLTIGFRLNPTPKENWRLKRNRNIAWGLYFGVLFVPTYGVYDNFSPSDLVLKYGFLAWGPAAVGLITFVIMKCNIYNDNIPRWKNHARTIMLVAAALYFSKNAVVYGAISYINRVSGIPFQGETVIIKKMSTSFYLRGLKLKGYDTLIGPVNINDDIWRKAGAGDPMTISGVQSVLGCSIDAVSLELGDSQRK